MVLLLEMTVGCLHCWLLLLHCHMAVYFFPNHFTHYPELFPSHLQVSSSAVVRQCGKFTVVHLQKHSALPLKHTPSLLNSIFFVSDCIIQLHRRLRELVFFVCVSTSGNTLQSRSLLFSKNVLFICIKKHTTIIFGRMFTVMFT